MSRTSAAPPAVSSAPQLLIAAGGLATSVVVVVVNFALSRRMDYNFLSLSVWLVVPVGAFGGGALAATGYYVTARLTQTMPSGRMLFTIVAIGCSTWLLSHWLDYYTLVLADGRHARDVVSFWGYFQQAAEHQQLVFARSGGGGTTGELGRLGYVREGLQLLAFMAGGFAVYGFLKREEVCERCRRYLKVKKLLDTVQPEVLDDVLNAAEMGFPGFIEEARNVLRGGPLVGLDLVLLECPRCHTAWVRNDVQIGSRHGPIWVRLERYRLPVGATARLMRAVRGATARR